MYTPRTLIALHEATVRTTRSGSEAFGSAALGARMSPGKKATVYVGPKGQYSYGIQSKSTGGKRAPKGFAVVGTISPGTGGATGATVLKRAESARRMKKQLDRIEQSAHLSDEEKARYRRAAAGQKGKKALPRGAQAAMHQATYGVDPRRKLAQPRRGSRTMSAMSRAIGGAAKAVGTAVSGLFGRRARKRITA